MYNANRLKEFCSWFQRINPKVNEIIAFNLQADKDSGDQLSLYTFLEYKFLKDVHQIDGENKAPLKE